MAFWVTHLCSLTPDNKYSQKHALFLSDFSEVTETTWEWDVLSHSLQNAQEGCVLAQHMEPPKIVGEWGVLSPDFQRLQKSILQNSFKNKGLVQSRAATDRPQGLVNRKRTPLEDKQYMADPRKRWAMGAIVLWGTMQGSLFEWQQKLKSKSLL